MPKARASRTNSCRYKRRKFLWLDQVKADDKLPRNAFVCCSACSMLVSVAGIQPVAGDCRSRRSREKHRVMSLSDSELTAVMTAAAPIYPRERDAFLRDVVAELAKYPEIGPGVVGRVVREIQRQHLAPRTGHNVGSKYGHGRYRQTICVALGVVLWSTMVVLTLYRVPKRTPQ